MIIIKNINENPRDPDVIFHNNLFYATYSYKGSIWIKFASKVEELRDAIGQIVFSFDQSLKYSKEIWAPELHIIDGKCYIYVAVDDGDNHNHRMFVLYNDSNDPLTTYKNHGIISDDTNRWAIDATVTEYNGKLYFAWSGWEGLDNVAQNIYIAEMSDPFTISSKRVMVSKPELEWELHGSTGEKESPFVNEGPYFIKHNGQLFIVYSASGCWTRFYCLGLLKHLGGDVLDPKQWVKHPVPILSPSETLNGPGHASFIQNAPDQEWCFYHAFINGDNCGEFNVFAHSAKLVWENDLPKIITD